MSVSYSAQDWSLYTRLFRNGLVFVFGASFSIATLLCKTFVDKSNCIIICNASPGRVCGLKSSPSVYAGIRIVIV